MRTKTDLSSARPFHAGRNITDEQRHRAVRNVAGTYAFDAGDLRRLLDALGLRPEEGRQA